MKFYHNNIKVFILSCILSVLLLLPLVISCGCGSSYRDDPRLRHIGESLSDPEISEPEALPLLDSLEKIPDKDLSEGERHYRDFLTIKASDKGYCRHASDSLYLTVKEYFSSHHSREMLPEVLYYGGRVYSDMGNYPIALQYFQEALDCMGDKGYNPRLRRRILSQTGRLLSGIRLYEQALPYVEESLKLGETLPDTLVQVYNLELAGYISANLRDYHKAQKYFEKACRLSDGVFPSEYALCRFEIGHLAYKQGDVKKAIPIIRETVNNTDSNRKNYVLSIAAQAYLQAGSADTAFMYAKNLIEDKEILNKEIGYYVLLSDQVRFRIQADTLAEYIRAYNDLLDKGRNSNMDTSTILQNSFYNYTLHDKARQKAENSRKNLVRGVMIMVIIVSLIIIVVLLYLIKNQKGETLLYRTIALVSELKNILSSGEGNAKCPEGTASNGKESVKEKMDKYREELIATIENRDTEAYKKFISIFRDSPLYDELIGRIDKSKSVEKDGKFWNRLEEFFSQSCPNFLPNLEKLTESKLNEREKQTAMLIKCGFRIGEVGKLLAKSKGAMVSRRETLSLKIFGEKRGSQYIDELIRKL